jgi:hypothetical protein
MTTHEQSRLARLREQYRKVVLREEVRAQVLKALAQQTSSAAPAASRGMGASAWSRWRSIGLAAVAGAVVGCILLVWSTRGPEKLEVVVSAVEGQAFSEGAGTRPLAPQARVAEGQRLRTAPASAMETKVGAHRIVVSAQSALVLESLRPRDLRFQLERGSVTMTVAPLGPGGRLRVSAGDLSVEVVGTVFSVQREGDCSAVSVRSGRVAVFHQGTRGEIRAGEERRFCNAPAGGAPAMRGRGGAAAPSAGEVRDSKRPGIAEVPSPVPPLTRPRDERPAAATSEREPGPLIAPAEQPRTEELSDEERMFRDASRIGGDAASRVLRLQEYLACFPEGMFAEDALFQLIRDSYATANPGQVLRFSEQFLARHHRGRRTSEVQLLYVQSLIEMGLPPGQSLAVLESLLSHLDALPPSQREQATYLAILAYCGAPKPLLCRQWIDRYLERYPHGLYAAQVRRSQMERGSSP